MSVTAASANCVIACGAELALDASRSRKAASLFALQLQQFFDRANISTMDVQEEKVLLSPDGYGRVAIVRRADGLLCLYRHWHWSPEVQRSFGVGPIEDRRWTADYDPRLYEDMDPLPGIYATIADAEKEAERVLGLKTD